MTRCTYVLGNTDPFTSGTFNLAALYIPGKRIRTGIRITMSHFAFLSLPRSLNPAFQPKYFKQLADSNSISMGRVKARQVKESWVEGSIVRAIELYKTGKKRTIREAAESKELAFSTLYGRLKCLFLSLHVFI